MHLRFANAGSATILTCALTAALLSPDALSQGFNNKWLEFKNATGTNLSVPADSISNGSHEVDFKWGDLDNNGFTDLVVVRKQPQTTSGKRTNVLLMNYAGVLTDMTSTFAVAADVPGDMGFLTPTNDRDVEVADLDADGWDDVVTAPAISGGDPKHISHPRIYHNLGDPGSGWLGLRFEDARIPQFLHFGTGLPIAANACGITAGDVDNDTDLDLYVIDYDSGGGSGNNDAEDRLLLNDGFGFFSDGSQAAMTPAMLASNFGTAGYIIDVNGDGFNDVIKSQNGPVDVRYNNPAAAGTFNILQGVYGGSAYHMAIGDLNNDGRLDVVASDDGLDRYLYNTGNDALGRVIWGPSKTFQFLAGGDDGFGNNSWIADLDKDGWNDIVITDVDVDIGGCSRRTHVYHNPGGTPGAQITLREERETSAGNGWLGAVGLQEADLTGGHDVAIFDIDNDGLLDMVLGRCSGTFVWINDSNTICQPDLGFGGPGIAKMTLCGDPLQSGGISLLDIVDGPPNSLAFMFLSAQSNPTFVFDLGGTVVPLPVLSVFPTPLGQFGNFRVNVPGGSGPASVYIQLVTIDAAQPMGYGLSNALRIDFLP